MFYRINDLGDAVIYHDNGERVTLLDATVYPVNTMVSARYETPEGIILTVEDAKKLGIREKQ